MMFVLALRWAVQVETAAFAIPAVMVVMMMFVFTFKTDRPQINGDASRQIWPNPDGENGDGTGPGIAVGCQSHEPTVERLDAPGTLGHLQAHESHQLRGGIGERIEIHVEAQLNSGTRGTHRD